MNWAHAATVLFPVFPMGFYGFNEADTDRSRIASVTRSSLKFNYLLLSVPQCFT